jgi:hypothetical protein
MKQEKIVMRNRLRAPYTAAVSGIVLTQSELYRLGALITAFCLLVFVVVGTPWLLFVTR